jgi:energy-coupling factor transporter ATP-binding protein EcfA2
MKLRRVELQNFRSFESASFDLLEPGGEQPLPVVLLVGGNGSGKSGFLQAVAGAFTHSVQRYNADRLNVRDVRVGQGRAFLRVELEDVLIGPAGASRELVEFGFDVVLDEDQAIHGYVLRRFPRPDAERKTAAWIELVSDRQRRYPAGLIVGFDVYRLLPPLSIAGPNIQGVHSHRCEDALAPTVRRGGGLESRFGMLKQWIVNLDFLRAKAKADRNEVLPLWATLHDALNTMLHPYVFQGVDDNFDVRFKTPTGNVVLESLSDGFRSIFVVITEMLFRLSLATDNPEKVLEQEGVCLIDEIDAHLHPRWQEAVIPGLRKLFPNVQLIATTHSPIVVSSVEPKNVFLLEGEE